MPSSNVVLILLPLKLFEMAKQVIKIAMKIRCQLMLEDQLVSYFLVLSGILLMYSSTFKDRFHRV